MGLLVLALLHQMQSGLVVGDYLGTVAVRQSRNISGDGAGNTFHSGGRS